MLKLMQAAVVIALSMAALTAKAQTTIAPDGHTMTEAERHRCVLVGAAISSITKNSKSDNIVGWGIDTGGRLVSAFAGTGRAWEDDELPPVKQLGVVTLFREAKANCLADLVAPTR